MKNFFLIISIIFSLNLFAKISDLDKQLLISTESSKKQLFKDRNVKFGLGKNNYLADYTFGSLMYIYQKYLSVQVSSSCLYNPTCSVYSKMLFERYGVFKGIFITADRITRCDRIAATDFRVLEINKYDHKVHEDVNYYNFNDN